MYKAINLSIQCTVSKLSHLSFQVGHLLIKYPIVYVVLFLRPELRFFIFADEIDVLSVIAELGEEPCQFSPAFFLNDINGLSSLYFYNLLLVIPNCDDLEAVIIQA